MSEVKNYYIQPAKNYIANRTPQNAHKTTMTGNLDQVFIDNENDSAWISNNTNLQFTNSTRPIVPPEPVPPHNTTYIWGMRNIYYITTGRDEVRASADSAEVANVFMQVDGKTWDGMYVSDIKNVYIMRIYDYMDEMGTAPENKAKVIFTGNLDNVNIDVVEDSVWISNNTQLTFTNTFRDEYTAKHR